jgi:hypothetical protein
MAGEGRPSTLSICGNKDVDARDKPGHDGGEGIKEPFQQ